jgi:lipoate-protein ligase A
MRLWRLITDDGVAGDEGLAADEALMLRYGRSVEAPDHQATLRLYTYRPHCALVGRYQHMEAEVDLEACERLGVEVGRRPTGGGAIIMGPEQLGVAVATRAPTGIGPRDLLRQYAGGIITGLARAGVHAHFRGKNDLEVSGRKIAGLGLYVDDRGAMLFHSSVLADLDLALMLEVLRIPGAKLADKGVERVQERITTASREVGRKLTGADLREAVADGFRETLGIELAASRLDASESSLARELVRERYGSHEWRVGRAADAGTRGTAALKTSAGFVRVYVGVQGEALSSVMVTGDFSVMPGQLLELEAALKWCRADRDRIAEIVRRGAEGPIDPEQLADAIWAAAERAHEHGAAPVRVSGSCYFPEEVPA